MHVFFTLHFFLAHLHARAINVQICIEWKWVYFDLEKCSIIAIIAQQPDRMHVGFIAWPEESTDAI
jgi:hypothetical protein